MSDRPVATFALPDGLRGLYVPFVHAIVRGLLPLSHHSPFALDGFSSLYVPFGHLVERGTLPVLHPSPFTLAGS